MVTEALLCGCQAVDQSLANVLVSIIALAAMVAFTAKCVVPAVMAVTRRRRQMGDWPKARINRHG